MLLKRISASTPQQTTSLPVPELNSRHREADPKLAFHAVYAARHAACVVADDTDVFMLLRFVAVQTNQKLYLKTRNLVSKGVR